MSASIPSREACVIDIPEPGDITGTFVYNFFTVDETTNESSVLQTIRQGDVKYITPDATVPENVMSRVPRYVELSFSPVKTSAQHKPQVRVPVGFIRDNVDKIMTEDRFTTSDYVSMRFYDGDMCQKALYVVSGAMVQRGISEKDGSNRVEMLNALQSAVPGVDPTFASSAFDVQASGETTFFVDSKKTGETATSRAADLLLSQKSLSSTHASTNVQINAQFFKQLVQTALSTLGVHDDMASARALAANMRGVSKQFVSHDDYKTKIKYVAQRETNVMNGTVAQTIEIVGYIIDKVEVTASGDIVHPSLYIEGASVSHVRDYAVKYATKYRYAIRAIARVDVPAFDESLGTMTLLVALISSRPSAPVTVKTFEMRAPPPPENLQFVWDYERDQLLVHWDFPHNPQRDIKKFQVFVRDNVSHAFRLLREFDFNDGDRLFVTGETPDPSVVSHVTSPVTSFYDDELTKQAKRTYAVCSVDAHGMSSCYSAQFEVSFDVFKNAITKTLVSHKGAPKQYPNMFLERSLFTDVIRVSGRRADKIDVCFVPECYTVVDRENRVIDEVQTDRTGGCYKLHIMNLDNQKSEVVTVNVSDRRSNDI